MRTLARKTKYKLFFLTLFVIVASASLFVVRTTLQGRHTNATVSSVREVRIVLTGAGYVPGEVVINRGDRVIFVNESDKDMWPASDLHPTHSLYPETGIWLCGTAASKASFDSCAPLSPGGTFSFDFVHEGEWRFHDHLWPSRRGVITVR